MLDRGSLYRLRRILDILEKLAGAYFRNHAGRLHDFDAFAVSPPQRRMCAMKGLLISAFASAVLALGWSALSTTPAKAYPHCIHSGYYYYCLANYYNPAYCIYYDGYVYCRQHGGGGSGY